MNDPVAQALRAMLDLHIAHHNHPTHAAARAALAAIAPKPRPCMRIMDVDLTSEATRRVVERERAAREGRDG